MLATTAVLGSGVALVVVAGSALNAWVGMGLFGWAAISTILLLRRRADPRRQMVAAPSPAPRRAQAQIVASRRAPELEAGAPAITYTVTRQHTAR